MYFHVLANIAGLQKNFIIFWLILETTCYQIFVCPGQVFQVVYSFYDIEFRTTSFDIVTVYTRALP